MERAVEELIERFVEAYRPAVGRRLAEFGVEAPAGMEEALLEGERWLRSALSDLLGRPFAEQARGPLEVFQEAMRFPTAALAGAGVPVPSRDPVARQALPGDHYGLAPASSAELGEAAWRAHLEWGAAKAAAMRPGVGLLTRDLIDRSKVAEAVEAAGVRLDSWASLEELTGGTPPAAAFVDLRHPQADEAIRRLTERGVPTVAFGPHVDDVALARARALGAADALPRSRFFRRLPKLIPRVA